MYKYASGWMNARAGCECTVSFFSLFLIFFTNIIIDTVYVCTQNGTIVHCCRPYINHSISTSFTPIHLTINVQMIFNNNTMQIMRAFVLCLKLGEWNALWLHTTKHSIRFRFFDFQYLRTFCFRSEIEVETSSDLPLNVQLFVPVKITTFFYASEYSNYRNWKKNNNNNNSAPRIEMMRTKSRWFCYKAFTHAKSNQFRLKI